jgi:hypothetical protein
MKTYSIEIQKLKAANSNAHGQLLFKVDAVVTPRVPPDGVEPSTLLTMTEANARVLMALLKAQFAEFDGRKARSQR